jgi:hypothetical protein
MKKLLLTAIAVLFLATGTAHAEVDKTWRFSNYKRCTATMVLKLYGEPPDAPLVSVSGLGAGGVPPVWSEERFPLTVSKEDTATVVFKRKHLAKLEAAVRFLKKCRIWVWDHHRGKAIYLTPKETKEMDNAD